jgi:K+-sensing histidine kinase KdpD
MVSTRISLTWLAVGRAFQQMPNATIRKGIVAVGRYAFAAGVVGTALSITLLLQYLTHYRIVFAFFAAVIVAGWIGGRGPAWFSVVLSLLAVDYFFAPPLHDLGVSGASEAFFVPFVAAAIVAGWCGALRKRAFQSMAPPGKAR